jgi:outer membrane protein OmpA-like peptidoglycan-associated protein
MIVKGLDAGRINAIGFGEQFPLSSNNIGVGRQQNRRVELEIIPKDTEPKKG